MQVARGHPGKTETYHTLKQIDRTYLNHPLPMKHSTPQVSTPKAATLDFLRCLARIYRPERGMTPEMAGYLAHNCVCKVAALN